MPLEINPQNQVLLARDTNQALGIGEFAVEFMKSGNPGAAVVERTNLFNVDAMMCGVSALALGTNAPTVLREEALRYQCPPGGYGTLKNGGAPVIGSRASVFVEKAVLANCAAVREWDSNGTNFGYNPRYGHVAGEFGHNDFYPVAIAAAQQAGKDGAFALKGMVLLDEIRGRLAEVFSLKTYKIDHVLHGAVASAAAYGAMMGATAQEIEHAIGMVVAHYVPFRAIRYGKQLSDSKGASAAISTEMAIVSMQRAMRGFIGPKDIFRNAEAVFCLFQRPAKKGESPFDLVLSRAGDDFSVMGMHFKLGLYEHQSAGALQSLLDLLKANPELLADNGDRIKRIKVIAYEPAYHIIGDPAKRDPRTRQSADHSMVYILSTLLRKAIEQQTSDWAALMLSPHDYSEGAIFNAFTRRLMDRIEFAHGGPSYDVKYPEGIPTSVVIEDDAGRSFDSGLCMFPTGHARNTTADLRGLLRHKFVLLGSLASDEPEALVRRFGGMERKSVAEVRGLYDFEIRVRGRFE
ncbi:MAG: MmgE/PrpD family protein [Phycisphaerales bacterium]|nr:MmgE/PrpD family protein [Phycisphaerales bacterium]